MRRAVALVALSAFAACSGGRSVDVLTVTGAWARPTPPGAENGVIYFTVESPVSDAVVGIDVPPSVASGAELHETTGSAGSSPMPNMPGMGGEGSEMSMVVLERVAVPAGGRVTFEPGGKHVMLVGLAAPLVAGNRFTMHVHFASGAQLAVEVTVSDNPPGS